MLLARFGVFTTTLVAFFLAEMGDKTQVATVELAAQYQSLIVLVPQLPDLELGGTTQSATDRWSSISLCPQ